MKDHHPATRLTLALLAVAAAPPPAFAADRCSETATAAHKACRFEADDDYWVAVANCQNDSEPGARKDCIAEARAERDENRALCGEQRDARLELCGALGGGAYDPDFGPFVDPRAIGASVPVNPWFPLVVGNRWTWREAGGGEEVVVQVLDKTKAIEDATCIVVNDVVSEDGKIIENTDDWFAQREGAPGDVVYCGESVRDFEYTDGDDPMEAELVEIDGSFKWGRDDAKPGIRVHGMPVVGQVYRQEFALGEAEDAAEVVSLTADESVPAVDCAGACLETRDFSPLEPGMSERKYYAAGIGPILEVNEETGKRVELVEYCNTLGIGPFPACP